MSLELLEVDPEQKGQEGLGRISDYLVIQAMTSLHKDVPIRYLVPHQPLPLAKVSDATETVYSVLLVQPLQEAVAQLVYYCS